ncbi:MAG TPA: alkaline phosphatase family protein [Vicinamibacteria bacterium]|nr:alkaline phosphatase family protein [Vicinamibacteria bacterium]
MFRATILTLLAAFFSSCQGKRAPETPPEPPRTERETILEMFARSYVPGRSGQIFVVAEKGNFFLARPDDVYRFMHGSPWEYDVEIPILFHGEPFVRKGVYSGSARQQDVAPTLAAILGLPAPTTMNGRVLREALTPGGERPRVVFLAVLDGMGADTYVRLSPQLPTLRRIRLEGAWFENARIDYLPTVTSAGHSTVATGVDPRFHGIHANATFDRRTGKEDEPFPGMSPKNYMTFALADHWSLATSGRAVVLAQGTTSRAAVALAGLGACAINGHPTVMAMYDERKAGWVTNKECFRLPAYLEDDQAAKVWEAAGGTWLDHKIDSGRTLLRTGLFPRFQADALLEMIEKESVGKDDIPDLVLVNFKTPDYVAHQYGPASKEMEEAMRALDSELGRILSALEASAGAGRTVLALTADHGMPAEPRVPEEERRYVEDIQAALLERFDPEGKLVLDFNDAANCQMYVSLERLDELHLRLGDLAAFLEEMPFIRYAFTEDQVRSTRVR